ncbi:MAG: heme-binding domain-containing protein [Planctomycetota bacterium]
MKRIAAVLVGVAVVIQFVPAARTNPPVTAPLYAPAAVVEVLRRSCYDCHSNEVRWPWYSKVAPVSWLIVNDVREARAELNFSTWGDLSAAKQADLREECYEEVSEGKMPLWFYTPLHPEAKLTEADLALLRGWSGSTNGAGAERD